MLSLRNLLVLGRTSNLPTVWSNCLAGWILGGGGDWKKFALLVVGSTLLYLAGMFLNDAFDARFDSEHRPQRPIPSGAVSVGTVFKVGFFLLFGGVALFFLIGKTVGWIGLAAPAQVSEPILERLNSEMQRILKEPEVVDRLKALSFVPAGESRQAFSAYLAAEIIKWKKVTKDAGVKIE